MLSSARWTPRGVRKDRTVRSSRAVKPKSRRGALTSSAREHPGDGIEVLRIRGESHAVAVNLGDHGVVDGRGHAALAAMLAHVAVEMIDLRAPLPHHVLQHRGASAASLLRLLGDVALDVVEAAPLRGVHEPLRLDPEHGLDLVAAGAAHANGFGGQIDRDPAGQWLDAALGG